MGIWQFTGAFTVVERQSELKISEANAGVKPANVQLVPIYRDQPANEQKRVLCPRFLIQNKFSVSYQ